jgi:hypothetical protein
MREPKRKGAPAQGWNWRALGSDNSAKWMGARAEPRSQANASKCHLTGAAWDGCEYTPDRVRVHLPPNLSICLEFPLGSISPPALAHVCASRPLVARAYRP